MKYEKQLDNWPCEPLVKPIPQVELVIPVPGAWLDELNDLGICPGRVVSQIVCEDSFDYRDPDRKFFKEDFPRLWADEIAREAIPSGGDWLGICVPIRTDVWQCVEKAAAIVRRTEHEVFLKSLSRRKRQIAARFHAAAPAEKQITLSVSVAALEALEAAVVTVEAAILALSPYDEDDCRRRVESWGRSSTRYVWSPRRALKWMLAAPRVRPVKLSLPVWKWGFIEKAAAALGVTPAEYCLSTIGYRAALEMRREFQS